MVKVLGYNLARCCDINYWLQVINIGKNKFLLYYNIENRHYLWPCY